MANLASYDTLSGVLGSRNRKQASAAGSSKYGSQAPRSGSLHGTSNSWGGKWSDDYSARDQDRFSGAPVDERLYVASSAGADLEGHADSRSTGPFFGRGTQDASHISARMGASQGPMMGLLAGDPGFVRERRDVAGSSTNPFVFQGSRLGSIADPRVFGFAEPTLPRGKADSLHSSVQSQAGASNDKAATKPAILSKEFNELLAICLAQDQLTDDQVRFVVSPGDSRRSIGSSMRSDVSKCLIDDDKASQLLLQAEERKKQAALEDTFAADASHIVMHGLGTSGLRASVSTAPSEYCVEALREIESLKIQLAKSQLDHKNCKMDLEQSELKLQKYNGEVEAYVHEVNVATLGWKQRMFALSLECADALETVLITQEKLIVRMRDQQCSLEASSLLLKKREEQIEELLRANAQLVDMDRADFPRNDEWVPVENPGEKLYIQRNVSLDAVKAMKSLDHDFLFSRLHVKYCEQQSKETFKDLFMEMIIGVVEDAVAECMEESPVTTDNKGVSDAVDKIREEAVMDAVTEVVEKATAGPVVQKLQAESSSEEEKPTYNEDTLFLTKQPYSREGLTRILEDKSVTEELEQFPFFKAVFTSAALKENLHRFCEDLIREANALWDQTLEFTNLNVIMMLKRVMLERKDYSPKNRQAFISTGSDFHNSCIPTGKPTANLNAFDYTAMSFSRDRKLFFNYFVSVYVSWGTDDSDLFVELVGKMAKLK